MNIWYLVITKKKDLPLEDDYMSGMDKCKYLGVVFIKNGNSNEETE
jgi:hypothetical protein